MIQILAYPCLSKGHPLKPHFARCLSAFWPLRSFATASSMHGATASLFAEG